MLKEKKEGVCIKCGGNEVYYGDREFGALDVKWNVHCADCNYEFVEYYKLVYQNSEDE